MPKPTGKDQKFYAVRIGRETGVFRTWADCEKQTKGYPGAKYQSFTNAGDAESFVTGTLASGPSTASTSTPSGSPTSGSKGKKRAMPEAADESKYDVVYSDGACKGNGKASSVAGIGVWWEDDDPRNIAERCPGEQTNNRAELIAIVRLLEETPRSKKPLLIKTDSQYSINCFDKWLPKWAKNNYKTAGGDPVKNLAVIKYVSALLKARGLLGQEVRLQYVKGHSGDRGNDGADAQANLGARMPEVPERDWETAEKAVTESVKEERRMSIQKPLPVPLQVAAGELAQSSDPPRKVRKVSHEVPFSRLPAVSPSKKPITARPLITVSSTSLRSPSPPTIKSPPPSLRVVEVSSSPPRATDPSQAQPTLPSEQTTPTKTRLPPPAPSDDPTATAVSSHPTARKSREPPEFLKSPTRRHGVGLFTTTPPPNAGLVKKFSSLPAASQKAKELGFVPVDAPSPTKVVAMSVDATEVNLDDYLDCMDDDDDPFDDV